MPVGRGLGSVAIVRKITGTPGTAIANVPGGIWGTDVHHQYSTRPVWNADQSIIYIDNNTGGGGTGAVFIDAHSLQPLYGITRPGTDFFWHLTDPSKMVWVNGNQIGYYFPVSKTKTTIKTFTGYTSLSFGPFKRTTTLDGSMIGITGTNPSAQPVVFAYNIVTDTQHPDIVLANYGGGGITLGEAGISPKGTYIQMLNSSNDLTVITDLAGNVVTTTVAGQPSHYDMTVDINGDEVMVGKDVSGGISSGQIVKVRMSDGFVTVLTPGTYGRYTSTRCISNRIYAVSSMEPRTAPNVYYDRDLLIYRLDSTKVLSLACDNNLTISSDFETEVIPCASPDASQVVFASNMGDPSGRPMGVYLISNYPLPVATTAGGGAIDLSTGMVKPMLGVL